VIYFALTKTEDPNPLWRVVEALQKSEEEIAIGWGSLASTQQPLLDQWQKEEIPIDQLLEQLALPDNRPWLEPGLRLGSRQVALAAPPALLRKLRTGEKLAPEEAALLPQGYRPRDDAFDNFLERCANSPRLRGLNPAQLYRVHLAAEQCIAESIVRFGRTYPAVKLLVLLPNDPMIELREVAEFAAQKSSRRQIILDRPTPPNESKPPLLTRRGRAFEVVNRAPGTGRHDLRLALPRLRAGDVVALLLFSPKEIARM
jgi:hypothetical protein